MLRVWRDEKRWEGNKVLMLESLLQKQSKCYINLSMKGIDLELNCD